MAQPHVDRFSPDEAAALWRRAAQLQAEALKRFDERSHRVGHEPDSAELEPDGIGVAEVRSIAAEVGIAQEYVQQALAEREIARSRNRPMSSGTERWASRVLADERRMLEASRLIGAEPKVVFGAMRRVFRSATYDLTLEDTLGTDPLQGAVLVFRVPKMASMHHPFSYAMAVSGVKELLVSLYPAPDGTSTEVRIRADLHHARKTNLAAGIGTSGTLAIGGAGAGTAMSSVLLAVSGAALAVPAVLGGVLLGGAAVVGYRAMYRWGMRKGNEALEDLLRVLDVDTRTDGAFALAPTREGNREPPRGDAPEF